MKIIDQAKAGAKDLTKTVRNVTSEYPITVLGSTMVFAVGVGIYAGYRAGVLGAAAGAAGSLVGAAGSAAVSVGQSALDLTNG